MFTECFDVSMNKFDQFCINYANEKIQNFCTHRLIHKEQEWYKSEGLDVPNISFPGNIDVLSESHLLYVNPNNCKSNLLSEIFSKN